MDVINQCKHMRKRTPTVPQVILQPRKEGNDIEDYIREGDAHLMSRSRRSADKIDTFANGQSLDGIQ